VPSCWFHLEGRLRNRSVKPFDWWLFVADPKFKMFSEISAKHNGVFFQICIK